MAETEPQARGLGEEDKGWGEGDRQGPTDKSVLVQSTQVAVTVDLTVALALAALCEPSPA